MRRHSSGNASNLGMPREIVMRHRTPHFPHVFSGDGYSSGYYSYLWSEVLDADAFVAFEETGDAFDPRNGGELEEFVYSAGNLRDPAEAYTAFRASSRRRMPFWSNGAFWLRLRSKADGPEPAG